MRVENKQMTIGGKSVKTVSICFDNTEITVTGKLLKTAIINADWYQDVEDPESLIRAIKSAKVKADLLVFMQSLPESRPKYHYYMEWDNLAAIPIKSFDYWFQTKVKKQARNRIRNAKKKGVEIELADFNHEFIKGMTNIFNETPIRQGKPFWHYGKSFQTVKKQFSKDADRCDLIGAYYNGNLIGFIWLLYAGRFARVVQIISMIEHRDKSPTNALLAEAVQICSRKQIPYLVYGQFVYGKKGADTLTDFKRRNGFVKIDLPRYYIPLNIKGKLFLRLGLHHGLSGILPKELIVRLLTLRTNWYARKYRNAKCSVK